ncbi:hypothetical protein D3C86_1335270 [compost metagenome]
MPCHGEQVPDGASRHINQLPQCQDHENLLTRRKLATEHGHQLTCKYNDANYDRRGHNIKRSHGLSDQMLQFHLLLLGMQLSYFRSHNEVHGNQQKIDQRSNSQGHCVTGNLVRGNPER